MTNLPAIRFIVETHSSAFDRNGNRSHWSRVTSTLTGQSIRFQSDGVSNARLLVNKATKLYGYPAVDNLEFENVPIRQWKASHIGIVLHEWNVTAKMIQDLEVTRNVGLTEEY